MSEATQKLQTILFADVANSTRLYNQLGDEQARALIALCLELMTSVTKEKNGAVIKTIGDEIMSTFNTPDQGVTAAIQMQEAVSRNETLAAQHIQLRIGLHHGPVIEEDNDVYGDAVNLAAGMVGQAKGGQIITNAPTLDLLGVRLKSLTRLVDQTRVKGKIHPIDVYEVSWGHPEELTMITTITGRIADIAGACGASMILETNYRQFAVNQDHPVITMGRDAQNNIIVNNPRVSRQHARIELRKDKFVLIDRSTNGTYLSEDGEEIILLRRDEVILPDQGNIGLGEMASSNPELSIRFKRS